MLRCNWITAKARNPENRIIIRASETQSSKIGFLFLVLMRRICCFGQNLSLSDNEIRDFKLLFMFRT